MAAGAVLIAGSGDIEGARAPAARIGFAAALVIAPLVAAAWLPPSFPYLARQLLLSSWAVVATLLAQRCLVDRSLEQASRSLGFVAVRSRAVLAAALVSLPVWLFLPLFASSSGSEVQLKTDWLQWLAGVVLVNGIAEEVIHRGFVFGNLRRGRSFVAAATLSGLVFALQHAYLVLTIGALPGLASMALAMLLAYPLALMFERGGNSLIGPAILHTSSNAPMLVFEGPDAMMSAALLPHMAVVLTSFSLTPLILRVTGSARPPAEFPELPTKPAQ